MSDQQEQVYRLIYKSEASENVTQAEVDKIVAVSKRNNKARNITGFLVFDHGQFMQLLKGDEQVVKDLYNNKIAKDDRHRNSRVVSEEFGPRLCNFWSMSKLAVGMFPEKKIS